MAFTWRIIYTYILNSAYKSKDKNMQQLKIDLIKTTEG